MDDAVDAPLAPYRALCDHFLAQRADLPPWADPEGARSACLVVSALFGHFAATAGHEAVVWTLEGDSAVFADPSVRAALADRAIVHCVVQLDGHVVIDWTARQFDPALPCPVLERRRNPWPAYWEPHVQHAAVAFRDWAALDATSDP